MQIVKERMHGSELLVFNECEKIWGWELAGESCILHRCRSIGAKCVFYNSRIKTSFTVGACGRLTERHFLKNWRDFTSMLRSKGLAKKIRTNFSACAP